MEENKLYWNIEKLREWDKNPRKIKEEDFARLKRQIQELGEYKPLIISSDGEVLGGNMRLKAYRELGFTKVWVSIIDAKDDSEKLKYALSDNDRVGYYDVTMLADLVNALPDFGLNDYSIDIEEPKLLGEIMDDLKFKKFDEDLKGASNDALGQDKVTIAFKIDKEKEPEVRDICFKYDYDLIKILTDLINSKEGKKEDE